MCRCTTHALYRFKLNNRTIASTLKMQIQMVQRLWAQLNALDDPSDGYGYGLWCGFKWGAHHATTHLLSRLESQHQSVPGCAEECGDPLVQSGDRWQTLGVAAGLDTSPQVQSDPGLVSEGVLRLCTLLSLDPPPTWTCWITLFGHTLRTSSTWPPTIPKPAWSPPFAKLPPVLVKKACSQFWIRIKAVIEAEGGYIE